MTNTVNIHKSQADKWTIKHTKGDYEYVTISLEPTASPSSEQYTGASDLTIFVKPEDYCSLRELRDKLNNILKTLEVDNV